MFSRRHFLALTPGALASSYFAPQTVNRHVPPGLDHIVLGCSDLHNGIDSLEKLSGYRAAIGGSHPGVGTWNALLALGGRRYLEIVAPDPQQDRQLWPEDLLNLTGPLIIGWALRHKDLWNYALYLRKVGVPCIGPEQASRTRPDGQQFRWTFLRLQDDKQGLMPFYVDWDSDLPHPSDEAPGASLLLEFSAIGAPVLAPWNHPNFPNLKKGRSPGGTSKLQAKIAGQFGVFELVSKAIPAEFWYQPQP
jgi:hypothetical protein